MRDSERPSCRFGTCTYQYIRLSGHTVDALFGLGQGTFANDLFQQRSILGRPGLFLLRRTSNDPGYCMFLISEISWETAAVIFVAVLE